MVTTRRVYCLACLSTGLQRKARPAGPGVWHPWLCNSLARAAVAWRRHVHTCTVHLLLYVSEQDV